MKQHDPHLLIDLLRCSPPCDPNVDPKMAYMQDDHRKVQGVRNFCNHLASRFSWTQEMFRMTLPAGAAFMASRSRRKRETGMKTLKPLVEAVLHAQDSLVSWIIRKNSKRKLQQ